MFKKVMDKLKQMMPSDHTDTWRKNTPVPAAQPPSRKQSDTLLVIPQRIEPDSGNCPENGLEDLLDKEFRQETASKQENLLRIVEPDANSPIPCTDEVDRFTEEGLRTRKTSTFIKTAEGRLIKPEELHRGGECSICNKLIDAEGLARCFSCKKLLCSLCAREFEGTLYCPRHCRQAQFNKDTWRKGG